MTEPESRKVQKRGFSGKQLALFIIIAMMLTAGTTYFIVRTYVFPKDFEPVTLSVKEEQQLSQKLQRLGWKKDSGTKTQGNAASIEPTPYTEADEDREVRLSEKELNSLIGGNPDLARRVAIDLADDLASALLLVPIPPDFPFMPGRILRVNAGLEMRLDSARQPVIALRGVSIMGVPIPNAWLGNLKNVDLVGEFGDRGFWKAFAEGVEDLQVRDGELIIKLAE